MIPRRYLAREKGPSSGKKWPRIPKNRSHPARGSLGASDFFVDGYDGSSVLCLLRYASE